MTRKYVLVFVLILILPIVAIHQGIVSYSERVMQTTIVENNEIMAEMIVNRVNSEINDVVSQLQLVAGLSDQLQLNMLTMYSKAKQAITKSTIIQSIYFLDENKSMRFEAPFRPIINNVYYDYPKFDHVKWSYTYVVSGIVYNVSSVESITVAIPVFYEDRKFQGVLVAELSRNSLSNMLRSTSETRDGFGFITDSEGVVIASTNERDWDQNFSEEPIVKLLLKGDSGSVQEAYQGKKSVMTYQTMRENWGLALGVTEETAFVSLKTLSEALSLSFLGIFILIICMIIIWGRQTLVPILKVTKYTQRIQKYAKGPIPLPEALMKRKDEIGELVRAFQDMNARVASTHRFQQEIIDGIPYALITLNELGEITRVNRKWVEMFGQSEHAWEGKKLTALSEFSFLTSNLTLGEQEVNWKDRSGNHLMLNVVKAKFHDGILAVVQDVTQIRMLESHVKQSEQLALMGQITTGIAHELKNPLAVLSSSSELLREEIDLNPDSEWVPILVYDIDSEISRMTSIVNEFLMMAKSKKEVEAQLQLDKLVNRVLHLLRIKFNEMGITVKRDMAYDIPEIVGKSNKLIQVFLNLLLNSVEAMPNGGVISIRIFVRENEICVEIADEGTGISEEQLGWLFNPFFSTKENGNGLGLSIARDIMKEHGGRLHLSSGKRKGTVVTCQFPLQQKEVM